MNQHSDEKMRIRITSPTFDDADELPNMTRDFPVNIKSGQKSSPTASGKHQFHSEGMREGSPTDR